MLLVALCMMLATGQATPAAVDLQWAELEQDARAINDRMAQGPDRSVTDELRPEIRALLDRVLDFTRDHADHVYALELQAEVAMALDDRPVVDQSFRQLMTLDPTRKATGLRWARHHADADLPRALEIMDWLVDQLPGALVYHEVRINMLDGSGDTEVDLRLKSLLEDPRGIDEATGMLDALARKDAFRAMPWALRFAGKHPDEVGLVAAAARALRGANRFGQARALLATIPPEQLNDPKHRYLLADTWYADHHFDEALAMLSSIDTEAVKESQPGLVHRVDRMVPLRQAAVESWALEQHRRSQDARRGDNPLARLLINEQEVIVELFEDSAPNAVANFIVAADLGLFDARPAGWVHTGFRTIMGDRHVDDELPYWTLPDDQGDPGARAVLTGSLVCYKEAQLDSSDTTFFILHFPAPHLDGIRTTFGRVVTGIDVVREMRQGDLLERVEIVRRRDTGYDPEVVDVTGRRLPLSELLNEDPPPPEGERTSSGAPVRRRHCHRSTPPSSGRP